MKKYTTPNTLLLCLFFVSLLFAACKDKGNEEVKQPTATTTPLEGTWKYADTTTNPSEVVIFVFAGSNVTFTMAMENSSTTPATSLMALVYTGTFRLDNANLYLKFNAVSYTDTTNTTPITNPTDIITAMSPATSLPYDANNTEFLFGTFVVNGSILTLTDSSNPSQPVTLTKL